MGDEGVGHTEALAVALFADTAGGVTDICAVYEALAPLMAAQDHVALGVNLELCPVHFCDARICADDSVYECEALREGRTSPLEPSTAVIDCIEETVERYELAMGDEGENLYPLYEWLARLHNHYRGPS